MDGGHRPRQNADKLEQALEQQRRDLPRIDAEDRQRRAEAIEEVSRYVELLRVASVGGSSLGSLKLFSFKLVFPDGRWDVEEKRLAAAPSVGDVVDFSRLGRWRVGGSQLVRPRPARKPDREFFVCAPAA